MTQTKKGNTLFYSYFTICFVERVLLTFIAIPNCKEVHVVVFVVEEQQTDPRV